MNNDPKEPPNVKQAVPFFMVADMKASLAFYIDGLGFILQNSWQPMGAIEWCWLQLGGASLMLQEYRTKQAPGKAGEGVSIYFMCADALKIYEKLIAKGQAPAEPFVGNNLWVVPLQDPDGYHLFFESATDVPEETKYSDWVN